MKDIFVPHTEGPLFNDAFRRDPYSVYARLRRESPVAYDDALGAFIVTRAQDVAEVLKSPAVFSSNRVDLARSRFTDPTLKPLIDTLGLLMLQRDDPDHRRLRKLVSAAFQRTAVEGYVPRIDALSAELLAPGVATGQLDFVADYAVPLPILVISEIVGIPAEDRAKVKAWCDAFSIVALNFYAKISAEQLEAGRVAVAAFRTYLSQRVEAVRDSGSTSLLASLVLAEADGERLSLDELLANVLLLLNAGNETTTILLSNGLHALLRYPDAMARLRADPALIPVAVEEMLRFEAPVHFIGRVATRDTQIGGTAVRAGDLVLVFLASAGRDGDLFADPDAFDTARQPNHHQAFGNGPHLCAGVQLARVEAAAAFRSILSTFDEIVLEDGPLRYGPNLNLRSLATLPVRVTPRRG